MKLIYYGHACFALQMGQKTLLFDPYITPNVHAKHIQLENIKADYIFLSHGHFDHITDLLPIAKHTGAEVIASNETMSWLNKQGLERVSPLNIGGKKNLGFGSVKMVFAAHSNSLPDGSYGGTAAGFIVQADDLTLYYAGDTGLTYEMELMGKMHSIDYALLPIGGTFTMDAEDAAFAAKMLQAKNIIGIHYNSFPLIEVDLDEAAKIFKKQGLNLQLLEVGEEKQLGDEALQQKTPMSLPAF